MKKLVLVAALFMFVCGGTFLAQAKAPVEQPSKTTTLSNDTVVTDTLQRPSKTQQKWPNNSKHTTTKKPFPPCLFWETAFLIINC